MRRFRTVVSTFGLLMGAMAALAAPPEPPAPSADTVRVWPSTPPADCPFPASTSLTGIGFTGRHREYTGADTWYPTWASNGLMYSPFTDGVVENVWSTSYGERPTTGQAEISGGDPLNLTVRPLGAHTAAVAPYGGRYPCGSLVYNGIWYYGTYCLDNGPLGLNWEVLGPFVGFRVSRDLGRVWTDTPHTPEAPLFGETGKNGAKVKIGAPHFVDFGRNMQYSPDGKAYLVAHGATRKEAHLSWISGDQVYLIRVKPSPQTINDASAYEFFAGHDAEGRPVWTEDFGKILPLMQWDNRMGCVTMTYNAPLKKYLMCVTDGWPTVKTMNTYILEADRITGPFRLVAFMERFGEQGYFVNIPSRFISADGRTAWLCYSANFTNGYLNTKWHDIPEGSRYAMCLQEVEWLQGDTSGLPLISRDEAVPD